MALSFAVQRPSASRLKAFDSGSDDERPPKDELITDFSKSARAKAQAQAQAERLVIPSQPNKDWKAEASKLRALARKKQTYLPVEKRSNNNPVSADPEADRIVDKTVGGLKVSEGRSRSGTSTPTTQLAGQVEAATLDSPAAAGTPKAAPEPLSAEQLALRELLKGTQADEEDTPIETIFSEQDTFQLKPGASPNEEDLFQRDLASRPDSATLDDYARVPVEQFGAALLRGMSGSSNGPQPQRTEAHIPKARPSLLGIGAKALEMPEDGKLGKKEASAREKAIKRREEMHFVPLVKRKLGPKVRSPSLAPLPPLTQLGQQTDALLMPPPQNSTSSHSTPNPSRRRSPSPTSDSQSKRHRRDRSYSPDRRRRRDYSDDERDRYRDSKRDRDRDYRRRERSKSPDRRRRNRSRSPESRERGGSSRRYEKSGSDRRRQGDRY